jgi:hypothetical protein
MSELWRVWVRMGYVREVPSLMGHSTGRLIEIEKVIEYTYVSRYLIYGE